MPDEFDHLDRAALIQACRAMKAEIVELKRPDGFWWDGEGSFETAEEAIEDSSYGAITALCPYHILPQVWGAWRCLTVDEDGDPDETDVAVFGTEVEAERCWPDSLAAARAANGSAPHD